MNPAAGQLPGEPGINGSVNKPAFVHTPADFGIILELPVDFGGGVIGDDGNTGAVFDGRPILLDQGFADRKGAPVLPDNGAVCGDSGVFIPEYSGLTLVGNADARDVFGLEMCL